MPGGFGGDRLARQETEERRVGLGDGVSSQAAQKPSEVHARLQPVLVAQQAATDAAPAELAAGVVLVEADERQLLPRPFAVVRNLQPRSLLFTKQIVVVFLFHRT